MNGNVKGNKECSCVFCNRADSEADYMIESPQTGLLVCNRCAETIAGVVENVNLAEEDELEAMLEEMEEEMEDDIEDDFEDDIGYDMWFDWDDEEDSEVSTEQDAWQDFHEIKELLPRDIVNHLDKSIIGQERAKKAIATAIYQHERRVALGEEAKFQKNNMMKP